MFDIAFSELVIIAIIALVVIGPEKLPAVARTLGSFIGRLQRYMANVRSDIEREMQFEDLQKLQEEIKQGANKLQTGAKEVENTIGSTHSGAKSVATPADKPPQSDHSQ